MTNDPVQQLKAIFEAVYEMPSAERVAHLDEHCPADLRDDLDGLLSSYDTRSLRLTDPALEQVASLEPIDGNQPDLERIDEFEILAVLGKGGMGKVYLAYDDPLERLVAIKVLPPEYTRSADRLERFRQEAVTVANLRHPGIVPVHTVGHADGIHYIVMEYVEGCSLFEDLERLKKRGDLEASKVAGSTAYLRERAGLVALVADALHYTHEHGIIHRDVKPGNILLERGGQPRLADFGIAKHLDHPGTTTPGRLTGTVPYMAPEQAMARRIRLDGRADVFSLGVVLYELITLERPFQGETTEEILHNLLVKQPRRVRSLNRTVSRDLETICLKALEKDPAHRYQTAAHLAGDLRSYVLGRPILARRPNLWRRTRTWVGDHKSAALAIAGVLLVAMLVVLGLFEVSRRRSHTSAVALRSDRVAQLHMQAVDPETFQPGERQDLGSMPYDGRLRPGHYRFTLVAPDGGFAEVAVLVLEAGSTTELDVVVPPPDDPDRPDMVRIGAGEHAFGDQDADGRLAARLVNLPAFYIDRTEVSNAEYRSFAEETGHRIPRHWELFGFDEALADRPVVGVSLDDAQAYARWAGKRLPTILEWEGAMRAPDGRLLPWGGAQPVGLPHVTLDDAARLSAGKWNWGYEEYAKFTRPVGSDPQLGTPLGLLHGASNVNELTESIFLDATTRVVFKGASWVNTPHYHDLAYTWTTPLGAVSLKTGFRCAKSAQP